MNLKIGQYYKFVNHPDTDTQHMAEDVKALFKASARCLVTGYNTHPGFEFTNHFALTLINKEGRETTSVIFEYEYSFFHQINKIRTCR